MKVEPSSYDFHERVELHDLRDRTLHIQTRYAYSDDSAWLDIAADDGSERFMVVWDTNSPAIRDDLNELIAMLVRFRDDVVASDGVFWG